MIILNKNRILLILGALVISMLAFTIQVAQKEEIQPTVALPISNKTIVIDAGHRKTR